MPQYDFRCDRHEFTDTIACSMDDIARMKVVCSACFQDFLVANDNGRDYPLASDIAEAAPWVLMRRIFSVPRKAIMRSPFYRLSPDDPRYASLETFAREQELGFLHEDALDQTRYSKPEESQLVKKEINIERAMGERRMQDLHEFGRTVDEQIKRDPDIKARRA